MFYTVSHSGHKDGDAKNTIEPRKIPCNYSICIYIYIIRIVHYLPEKSISFRSEVKNRHIFMQNKLPLERNAVNVSTHKRYTTRFKDVSSLTTMEWSRSILRFSFFISNNYIINWRESLIWLSIYNGMMIHLFVQYSVGHLNIKHNKACNI